MGNVIIHVNKVWNNPVGLEISSYRAKPYIELNKNGELNQTIRILLNGDIGLRGVYQYPEGPPERDLCARLRSILHTTVRKISEANATQKIPIASPTVDHYHADVKIAATLTDGWGDYDPRVSIRIRSGVQLNGETAMGKSHLRKYLTGAQRGEIERVVERMRYFDYPLDLEIAMQRMKRQREELSPNAPQPEAPQSEEERKRRQSIRANIRPYKPDGHRNRE